MIGTVTTLNHEDAVKLLENIMKLDTLDQNINDVFGGQSDNIGFIIDDLLQILFDVIEMEEHCDNLQQDRIVDIVFEHSEKDAEDRLERILGIVLEGWQSEEPELIMEKFEDDDEDEDPDIILPELYSVPTVKKYKIVDGNTTTYLGTETLSNKTFFNGEEVE